MKNFSFLIFMVLIGHLTLAQSGDEDPVFVIVEQMPHLISCDSMPEMDRIGCTESRCFDFLRKNIQYPKDAIDAGIQGTVYVQFVINKEGYVRDAKLLRRVHPSIDNEAIRMINNLPFFVPGKQGDKPVSVQMVFPVVFKL